MPASSSVAKAALACLFACLVVAAASANPFEAIRNKASSAAGGNRLPDDNVEGAIWEYKGELEKGELEGQKEARIAGTFRTEDGGVFAVGGSIRLPGKEDIEKLIADLREGRPKLLQMPSFTPRRIGDFKVGKYSKLSISFDDESDDPNALYGSLVLRPKKRSAEVFIGDYQEKEGRKTVRTWQMTVRKVMD